jgi:hypothetical protein
MIIGSFFCALTIHPLMLFPQMLKYMFFLWLFLDPFLLKLLTKEWPACLAVEDTQWMGMDHKDGEIWMSLPLSSHSMS